MFTCEEEQFAQISPPCQQEIGGGETKVSGDRKENMSDTERQKEVRDREVERDRQEEDSIDTERVRSRGGNDMKEKLALNGERGLRQN